MTALRDNLIDLVKTISEPSTQFEYEANVPISNVPAELVCQWFDDMYHPQSKLFQGSFSVEECNALAEFHTYFDARADRIPDQGGVDALQQSPEWLEIQDRAKDLLQRLGWSS